MTLYLRNTERAQGNVIILLAFLLTGMLAVAGFAIDSTIYFLKRQELQSLAESVALGAAQSLPNRTAAITAAENWFEVLRKDGQREIAPAAGPDNDILSISFDDNLGTASLTNPYGVRSITIRIRHLFKPKIFPLLSRAIGVVGEAAAQISPADVVLVVDNSAAWIGHLEQSFPAFSNAFGSEVGQAYLEQCFSEPYRSFKHSVINLYDHLQQISTIRTAVIFSSSKTGSPFLFSGLGQSTLSADQLPFDDDEPGSPSTRCALATDRPLFQVPVSNTTIGFWTPRSSLARLVHTTGQLQFELKNQQKLLTREALWIRPAGSSTASGYIHPRFYYSNTDEAIALAQALLKDSRRQDGIEVSSRSILVMTDDAGKLPGESSQPTLCDTWGERLFDDQITLGVALMGHRTGVWGHNPLSGSFGKALDELRTDCNARNQDKQSTFLVEHVSLRASVDAFRDTVIPKIIQGLKKVELRR